MIHIFDHEKLDVYRVSLEFIAAIDPTIQSLEPRYRHSKDQLIRSSEGVPRNIAEGNGKRSPRERNRFFEIARGSAMECAATLDVLTVKKGIDKSTADTNKQLLHRVVSMLSRMTETHATSDGAGRRRSPRRFDYEHDYEHEHERSQD